MEDSNENRADSGECMRTQRLEMVQKDVEASSSVSPPPQTSPLTKVATPKPSRSSPAPTTAASNALPPCRVCGEKASGFHYGVNTCEACKGFFRRSLQRKQQYKCSGSGQCKIGIGKRSNCPLCRYNKCLSVGMSKSAIKTGRYTHEKRTQDILEVKQMEKSSTNPRSPMSYRFDPLVSCLQSSPSSKRSSLSPSTSPRQQNSLQAEQSPPMQPTTSQTQGPNMTDDKRLKLPAVKGTTFQKSSSVSNMTFPTPTSPSPVAIASFLTSTTVPKPAATYPKSTTFDNSKTFQKEAATNEKLHTSKENPFQNHTIPAQTAEPGLASLVLSIEDPTSLQGPESSTPTFHSPSALLDNYGQALGSADLTMLRDLRPDASPMTSTTSFMQTPSPSTTSPSEDKQSQSCSMSPVMPIPPFLPLSPSDLLETNDDVTTGPSTQPPAAMAFKPTTFDNRSQLPNVSRSSCSNDERLPSMMPLSTPMPPTPPRDFQDYESIISTLVEAHKTHIMSHTYTPIEEILTSQTKYFEEFQQREAMFGSLSTLSHEQYMDFYEKTGIDIDNRQEIIQFVASQIDDKLRRYISFVKVIPGFTDLPIDDQAALVKAARFEFWFVGAYQSFSSDLSVISLPNGKSLHMKEMGKIWDKEFLLEAFRLAETFKKLKLMPDEFVLVKCICNTFADRCVLKNHALVEEIQWRLIQCLFYLLNKNHPNEQGVFARIIDRITDLRKLTEDHYRLARNLQIWPALNQNPLFMEMISF